MSHPGFARLRTSGRPAAVRAWLRPRAGAPALRWAIPIGVAAGAALGWTRSEATESPVPEATEEPTMALGLALPAAPTPDEPTTTPNPERRKRPTPMRPEEATGHLRDAFTEVLGTPPSGGALSILWAHWALETGRGLWMRDYNFAGIQGVAPDGGSAVWWTSERLEGETQRVRLRFRAYATPTDGAIDYVRQLRDRFPLALDAARAGDPRLRVSHRAAGSREREARALTPVPTALTAPLGRATLGRCAPALPAPRAGGEPRAHPSAPAPPRRW
jgi:hypothetical protein